MKTLSLAITLFCLWVSPLLGNFTLPTELSINADGTTSDEKISVEVWDPEGELGNEDFRIVIVQAPKGYLIGGRVYFAEDGVKKLNLDAKLYEGGGSDEGKEFLEVHIHKDLIKGLSFNLYKKSDDEYPIDLSIEGSEITKIKKLKIFPKAHSTPWNEAATSD